MGRRRGGFTLLLLLLLARGAWAEEGAVSVALPEAEPSAPPVTRGFGPFLALGAPHPLAVGLRLRWSPVLDWEAEGGLLSFKIGSRHLSVSHTQVSARWYPGSGGFQLGAGVGYQSVAFSGPFPITGEDGAIRFNAFYVTPQLGYEWKLSSGLTLGSSIGWQVPFLASGAFFEGVTQESRRSLARVAGLSLPTLSLLRLGWSFPL